MYDEAVRRFAPYVGTSYQTGCGAVGSEAGRGLRDLRRSVAALVVHDPGRRDERADAVGRHPLHRDPGELEAASGWRAEWLGCSVDRWLENKTWEDVLRPGWTRTSPSTTATSRSSSAMRWRSGSTSTASRATATTWPPARSSNPYLYTEPDDRRPQQRALRTRSGIYANGQYFEFDQMRVTEDVSHSFYRGHRLAAPVGGRHRADRPGGGQGRASTPGRRRRATTSPVRGTSRSRSAPLARQMDGRTPDAADAPGRRPADQATSSTRSAPASSVSSPGCTRRRSTTRTCRSWLDQIDLHGELLRQAHRARLGQGFGSTEAARGALRTGSCSRTARSRTTR
jgi:hypothetical protein